MLWCAVLLCHSAVASVLQTNINSLALTSYPIPKLSVYGQSDAAYAGEAISFDASGSTLPSSTSTYYYLFEFGDGSASTQVSSPTATHIYVYPGVYRTVLRLSDSPFVNSVAAPGIGYYSVTSAGYPAAAVYITITVLAVPSNVVQCYPFVLSNFRVLSSGSESLDIGLYDPSAPTSSFAAATLTNAFIRGGPLPIAVLYNMTHQFTVPLTANTTFWNLYTSASILSSSSSPVILSMSLKNVGFQACGVRDSLFDVSLPSVFTRFGYSLNDSDNGVYRALSLKQSNYKPAYFRVFQNSCSKKTAIAVLGSSVVGDGMGAIVIVSSDAFGSNYLLRDLSKDYTGEVSTNGSLCYYIQNCATLQIQKVVVLNTLVVFATNRGLYCSNGLPVSASVDSYFFQCITGQTMIDNGITGILSGSISISGTVNCYGPDTNFIFVSFSSTSSLNNNLIYSSEAEAFKNVWSNVVKISSISGLSDSYAFIGMTRAISISLNIYLVGIPSSSCGAGFCANNAMIVAHDTITGAFSTTFSFPASTFVSDLSCHVNGVDCYVYGSELWHSIDGGRTWIQTFVLETVINSVIEVFQKFVSSQGKDVYALVTTSKNIYYGRAGSQDLILVKTVNALATDLVDLVVDELGSIYEVGLHMVTSYSSTAGDYPMGFLKTISGQLRDSTNPYLWRTITSIDSIIPTTDFSFAAHLVPVFISKYRVQFYAYSVVSGSIFSSMNAGQTISQVIGGGKAWINTVSAQGLVVDCKITADLSADSASKTFAIDQGLIISTTLGNTWTPLISDAITPTTTSLSLDGTGVGIWTPSDVGKTVVANHGSFLITGLTSSTIAIALVFRAPLSIGTVASGSWKVYDFRSFTERAQTETQSVVIGSVSNGIVTVTISAGTLSFSASLRGMFFVTNSGWGMIQDVTSTATLLVTPYESFTVGTLSSGSWSIFDTNDNYIPGSFPTVTNRNRPWSLTVSDCPWDSFQLSTESGLSYLNYKDSFSISASVTGHYYQSNPYYLIVSAGPIIMDPSRYNVNWSMQASTYNYSTISSLAVSDVGAQGANALTLRPTYSTLMCETTIQLSSRLVDACSPFRFLSLNASLSEQDFLYGNTELVPNLPQMQILPVNYRPPSNLGISIPTSSNIYNADPSAPRYNDRYAVSQRTGQYKQCSGKANRAFCNCTDAERYSMKIQYSDCMDRVPRVFNDVVYLPQFLLNDIGKYNNALSNTYFITELNNRTDYCLTTATTTVCQNATLLYSTAMNPATNDSITWLSSSSELYHFRVTVAGNEFCSALSLEFAVYVILPTPRTSITLTYMSICAVAFAMFLLLFYVVDTERQKRSNL